MIGMYFLNVTDKVFRTKRSRMAIRGFFQVLITTRISLKFAAVTLRRKAIKCNSIEDYVDLAFNILNNFPFKSWSIRTAQVKEEITELLRLPAKQRPKFLLAIGTAGGGTTFLFSRVSSPEARLISVDLPGGRFGGGYSEWRKPFYESFAMSKQKIHLLREDSHAPTTFKSVKKILKGRWLDFLFIDGNHTYEGIRKDFDMYSKLLNPTGIIAFHDIAQGPPEKVGGVPRFWSEIKHKFSYVELAKNWKQGGYEIGVIFA